MATKSPKDKKEKYVAPKRIPVRGTIPGWNGKLNQFGYEKYTQDSEEHQQGFITALNNKFPNLVGFGIYQYMKQLWALHPRAKIEWTDENIRKLSLQMNVEESILRTVVEFCRKELKLFCYTRSVHELRLTTMHYIIYPEFMKELIELEVRKMQRDAMLLEENQFKKGEKNEPTAKDIKKIAVAKMKEFLIFTPEIKQTIENNYPKLGKPNDLWEMFMYEVSRNYLKWESLLTPDNYEKLFYVFLNNTKPSEEEYLSGEI